MSVSTSVIVGKYSNGQFAPYFVPGPDYAGMSITPIVKKISPGLRNALLNHPGPNLEGVLYWTPYLNELRASYSIYGNPQASTGFYPYQNSAFQAFQILYESAFPSIDWKYDVFDKSPRDPLGMALSALSLGAAGLDAQSGSYSDVASAAAQGFSFLQKLAPLAGKTGIKAVPYLGLASTILDVLSKLLDLMDAASVPDLQPDTVDDSEPIEVYSLPGETLPINFNFPDSPQYSTVTADLTDTLGTYPSVKQTLEYIYSSLSKELWLYIESGKLPPVEPYTKLTWQALHMPRVFELIKYFRKYFRQFGTFFELEFSFADWLTVDPVDYDTHVDFFLFLRSYLENLSFVLVRSRSEDSTIFRVIDECGCSRELVFPESGLSLNLTIPTIDQYISGRTHQNLEDAISSSGCDHPYALVDGYSIFPLV